MDVFLINDLLATGIQPPTDEVIGRLHESAFSHVRLVDCTEDERRRLAVLAAPCLAAQRATLASYFNSDDVQAAFPLNLIGSASEADRLSQTERRVVRGRRAVWALRGNEPTIFIPLSSYPTDRALLRILVHELTHAHLYYHTARRLPAALGEGVAQFMERYYCESNCRQPRAGVPVGFKIGPARGHAPDSRCYELSALFDPRPQTCPPPMEFYHSAYSFLCFVAAANFQARRVRGLLATIMLEGVGVVDFAGWLCRTMRTDLSTLEMRFRRFWYHGDVWDGS